MTVAKVRCTDKRETYDRSVRQAWVMSGVESVTEAVDDHGWQRLTVIIDGNPLTVMLAPTEDLDACWKEAKTATC